MPTLKQQMAFDKILENPAKPLGEIMLEVGYDESSATAPTKNLLETKGFLQLLNEHGLDDYSLAKKHKELLDSDHNIAVKALDMAYKVKSHYAPDRNLNINANIEIKPQDEKAKSLAEKYEEELLNTIQGEST